MLLSDLGQQTMMQVIDPQAPPPLDMYLQAVDLLVQWQLASRPGVLPAYDEALLQRELALFPQWYLGQHRQAQLIGQPRRVFQGVVVADASVHLRPVQDIRRSGSHRFGVQRPDATVHIAFMMQFCWRRLQ